MDRIAKEGDPHAVEFKRVYLEKDSRDFSFSGTKTGVINYLPSAEQRGETVSPADIAASTEGNIEYVDEDAIQEQLSAKNKEAADVKL